MLQVPDSSAGDDMIGLLELSIPCRRGFIQRLVIRLTVWSSQVCPVQPNLETIACSTYCCTTECDQVVCEPIKRLRPVRTNQGRIRLFVN